MLVLFHQCPLSRPLGRGGVSGPTADREAGEAIARAPWRTSANKALRSEDSTISTSVILGARLGPDPLGSGRIGGLGQAGRAPLVPVAACRLIA